MTAPSVFWLTFAPALFGAVLALIGDSLGSRDRSTGTVAAALMLAAAGIAGVVGGWIVGPKTAVGPFMAGAAFSTVPGLVFLLSAASLAAHTRGGSRASQGAALIALGAVGSAVAAVSTELVATILALETAAVCAYALVATGGGKTSAEAAFKYFLQGAVATGVMVLAASLFGGVGAGDLRYQTMQVLPDLSGSALLLLPASVLATAAFAFKGGAAPFHSWAPDAYEGAAPGGAALLAGPAKLAAGVALIVFVFAQPVGESVLEKGSVLGALVPVLAAFAGLSVLIGSLVALRQRSYARMLGYAGIAQMGYALTAAAALNPSASVVHLSLYAVATAGAFVAMTAFRALLPAWDGSIAGLSGLGRRSPVLGGAVALIFVSLAGIPPLAGFWGKFQVFGAAIAAGAALLSTGPAWAAWTFVGLAVLGIAGSVVSLGYYGAVLSALFFGESAEGVEAGSPDRVSTAVVVAIAVILLVAGLAPLFIGLPSATEGFLLRV